MQKCLMLKCRLATQILNMVLWLLLSEFKRAPMWKTSHPTHLWKPVTKGFERFTTDGSWRFLFLITKSPVRMEPRRFFSIYSLPSVSHLFCLEQERLKCFAPTIRWERSPSRAILIRQIEVESPHLQINIIGRHFPLVSNSIKLIIKGCIFKHVLIRFETFEPIHFPSHLPLNRQLLSTSETPMHDDTCITCYPPTLRVSQQGKLYPSLRRNERELIFFP